jgi:hypothetical protein
MITRGSIGVRLVLSGVLLLATSGCRAFLATASPEDEEAVPLHDIDDPRGAQAELEQIEEELGPRAYDRATAVHPGPAELEVGTPGAPR